MKVKLIVYLIVTVLVIIGLDAVNINSIFKKNRVFQARLFYLLLITSLVYLVTNFIMYLFTERNEYDEISKTVYAGQHR